MLYLYRMLIFLHVLSVVASIGPFFLLYPLVGKLKRATAEELELWVPIFKGAVTISKHAGHVLVVTGALLIWQGPWSWLTSWVIMTLIILFSSLFFIARAFSPTLRKLKEPDADREALVKILWRSLNLYVILMIVMMWLMVVKPSLW